MAGRNRKGKIEDLEGESEELRIQLVALSEQSGSIKVQGTPLTDDDRALAKETREHLDKLRTAHDNLMAADRESGRGKGPGPAVRKQATSRYGIRRKARRKNG
jgi:hypothetical protein